MLFLIFGLFSPAGKQLMLACVLISEYYEGLFDPFEEACTTCFECSYDLKNDKWRDPVVHCSSSAYPLLSTTGLSAVSNLQRGIDKERLKDFYQLYVL